MGQDTDLGSLDVTNHQEGGRCLVDLSLGGEEYGRCPV